MGSTGQRPRREDKIDWEFWKKKAMAADNIVCLLTWRVHFERREVNNIILPVMQKPAQQQQQQLGKPHRRRRRQRLL